MTSKRKRRPRSAFISFAESMEARRMLSTNVTLDASQQFQTIAGFGTSMYSAATQAAYDAPVGSTRYQSFINDYANDLGANFIRINFDPDVLPAKPATPLGADLAANIAALNFHSVNASFFGNLSEAINTAEGGKLQAVVTIWSPPAWMKANNSVSGLLQSDGSYNDPLNHLLFQDNTVANAANANNNLDPANLTQFARYCAAYVAGMEQKYGLNIVGLSIQNELLFNESYGSCSYLQDSSNDPADIQYRRYAQAVKAVGEELYADGITTKIMGPESVAPDAGTSATSLTVRQLNYIKAVDADTVVDSFGKTASDYLGIYAVHGTGGDTVTAGTGRAYWTTYENQLLALPVQRPTWQTEESGEAQSWIGAFNNGSPNPLRGALAVGLKIHDTFTFGNASAYLYWQTTDGKTNYSPVLMDGTDATLANPERTDVPQWKYLAFKHWSDFIKAGSVRIGTAYTTDAKAATTEDPNGVNTDAYVDPTGNTLTVELTNISTSAQTVHIKLANMNITDFSQAWLTDAATTWGNLGPILVANGIATLTLPGSSIVTLQGSTALGSAAGLVYADTNANSQQDIGETGLPNATVYLDINNNGSLDPGEPNTTTDANGNYILNSISAGNYIVRATAPGWRQSDPLVGGDQLLVSPNTQTANLNLGLTQAPPVAAIAPPSAVAEGASISLDASSSFEIAGSIAKYQWDLNYNGVVFNPAATGITTQFSAKGLDGPSTRTVALEVTGADLLTSSIVTATITINDAPPTAVFSGNSVILGNDGTVSFTQSTDPSPADVTAGFTYSYDFDDDGVFDLSGSTSATAIVPAADLTNYGAHTVAGRITDKDGGFTNYTITVQVTSAGASISGVVFNDANSNGKQDPGELGIPNITLYNDANNDGKLNTNELTTATTDASGNYSFLGLPAGNYKIRQILPPGSKQTTPSNGYGWTVSLKANQTVTGDNFGQQSTAVTPPPPTGGSISGNVFNDLNGNGTLDAGEVGLGNITLYNDANNDGKPNSNELKTTTDVNGNYSFTALPAGNYKIREILPVGWKQITPTNNFGYTLTLATNQSLIAKNFGEQSIGVTPPPSTGATISGTVFNDSNNDMKEDNGELGLSTWTVFIDTNNDGLLDNGELNMLTKSDGAYSFTGLAAGTYILRAVRPTGWSQTTPANGLGQHVAVTTNQTKSAVLFGERKTSNI